MPERHGLDDTASQSPACSRSLTPPPSRVAIRPYEPGDADGIARLRESVYPCRPEAHDVEWHRGLYAWLEASDLADQMSRWVISAGGEVVGHLAAVPQRYRIAGRSVVAHTPADYMVLPKYGFHAIGLMRTLFRTSDNVVSCDWEPTVQVIERRLGAEPTATLRQFVKPLDLSKRPGLDASKRLGAWVGARAVQVGDAVFTAASRGAPATVPLEAFDASFDGLFERIARTTPASVQKEGAFLRWRYGPGSPQHPVTILGVRSGEELLGYVVLLMGEAKDGYILDLMMVPGHRSVGVALLRDAVAHFWRAGAYLVRHRAADSAASPDSTTLRRMGFVDRTAGLPVPGLGPRKPFAMLVRLADAREHAIAAEPANWSYSVGDGEAGFWIR